MNIKEMPKEERPRERLVRYGAKSLTDRELLAILIRTGTKSHSAIELADKVLSFNEDGILFLANCMAEELSQVDGIGYAKACQLLAACELGRRVATKRRSNGFCIEYADQAAALFSKEIGFLKHEAIKAMILDTKGKVISIESIAEGGLNSVGIQPREVFNIAIRRNAFAIILGHNHPSGDVTPSKADIDFTKRLCEVGQLVGIHIADHIIVGGESYYSFKENHII